MTNRLIDSLSPYLLQHAHNPVDWHPWGEEALALARAEDRPIFLSIGYSACHWCHVMERESFEHPEVAKVLNAHFVPIKVDREERPDLDALYMDAVQTLTGHGGWPMSVWLTPDLEPFFGGTYFPPEPRRGMPGFLPLLRRIHELWTTRREDVAAQARELTEELQRQTALKPGEAPGEPVWERLLQELRQAFDARWGGFSPAPKFPSPTSLQLLFRRGTEADRAMARRTLDAMWEGGMYDHLGGGFARYSVDARWLVPHFEKMLYDNAQLACAYLEGVLVFREPRDAQVARETLDYLLRDLKDSSGGFHSAEDADSEGEEGRFYVFTPDQVKEALGPESSERFCAAYGISEAGNFEHGASVLHRFSRPPGMDDTGVDEARETLRRARDSRIRPAKDDKVLAEWNGLALSAFAKGHQVLGDPSYLQAAEDLAAFVVLELWDGQRLLRVFRHGEKHTPAFLEDYAALILGLADLYECAFDPRWLDLAAALADAMRARFEDPAEGGFFTSEADRNDLLFRRKSGFDHAIPGSNALAARALLRLARHLDREDYADSAEGIFRAFGPWMHRAPRAFQGLLLALDEARCPAVDLVFSGPLREDLLAVARRAFIPGLAISQAEAHPRLPRHEGRLSKDGTSAAFLCTNRACLPPASTPEELARNFAAISP